MPVEEKKTIDNYNVNILNDGEKKVYFLDRYDAHRIILEENLNWSYAMMFRIPAYGYSDGRMYDIRIHYFNSDNEEIASYDIDLEILTFLSTPRITGKEFIDKMYIYHTNN